MKWQCLSYDFLCLLITFTSAFAIDDVDTDTIVQFLLKEFHSLRDRVSVLENVIEKQTEIIQKQNVRIGKLENMVQSGSFYENELEESDNSLRDNEDGENYDQSHDNYTDANNVVLDAQTIPKSFIQRKASQERKSESKCRNVCILYCICMQFVENNFCFIYARLKTGRIM
jgi:hypothetical protein